jgi:hypothetical protein
MLRLSWITVSLIVALSLVALAIRPSASSLQNVAPAIGIGLAWLLLMWAAPRYSAGKQFRGTPSAQNPMTIDASESGVNTQFSHGESQVAWSAFVGWAEDKSVFIILPPAANLRSHSQASFHSRTNR